MDEARNAPEAPKAPRLQELHRAADVVATIESLRAKSPRTDEEQRQLEHALSLRKRLIHAFESQDELSKADVVARRALKASLNPPPGRERPIHSATVEATAALPESTN